MIHKTFPTTGGRAILFHFFDTRFTILIQIFFTQIKLKSKTISIDDIRQFYWRPSNMFMRYI
jgi:hypothetical protein